MAPIDFSLSLGDEVNRYMQKANEFSLYKLNLNDYSNYKVSAMPFLRAVLNSEFNLSNNKNFSFILTPSKLNFKNKSKIVRPYFGLTGKKNESIKPFGDSKEKHLVNFINIVKSQTDLNITRKGDEEYNKRYIAYNDWLLFSALFTYYDGRRFKDGSNTVLNPRFVKKRSCSAYSYRLALNQTFELIKKEKFNKLSEEDLHFIVGQLQKVDQSFRFFKINAMNTVRESFLSEESLKEIFNSLDLGYKEVINLINIFDARVFNNDEFIEKCICSKHINPLFVFVYFFRFYMIKNRNATKEDDTFQSEELKKYNVKTVGKKKIRLIDLIDLAKAEALEYIEIVCENNYDGEIQPLELKESKFIQSYYFDNNQLEKCVQKDGFETGSEYLDYLIEKVMKIVPKFFKDVQ